MKAHAALFGLLGVAFKKIEHKLIGRKALRWPVAQPGPLFLARPTSRGTQAQA
jgi:hypothetical protein